MKNLFARNRMATSLMCLAIAGGSAFIGTAIADDMMAPSPTDMMKGPMMAMHDGMKDDAMKMQMSSDLAKMMVMEKMSAAMCHDDKCVKMMKEDPDMMKMMDEAKKMAMDPDKSKMMMDDVSKDPEAMKKVMMMSMAHEAMMEDKNMVPMDKGGSRMDKK